MKTILLKTVLILWVLGTCHPLSHAQISQDSSKNKQPLSKSPTKIQEDQFNQGLITDPLQLIQAKLPSLYISRSGSDPNGFFDIRNRGLKSFSKTEPIFLLNGMPVRSFQGIHPQDIASFEILQDGANMAKWGMRGSNGILSIETKTGQIGKSRISYHTSFASDIITRTPDVLTADEFAARGGSDRGSGTDWWEEITRISASQTHHLSLSGANAQSNYYASVSFDDINGIAKNSGFDRVNGFLSFQQKALNDRLDLGVNLGSTYQERGHIPRDIFKLATQTNPTFPIRGNDNGTDFIGGYFQPALFDTYNPIAVLELISLQENYQQIYGNLSANLEITTGLDAKIQYANQSEEVNYAYFAPSTSRYLNGLFSDGVTEKNYEKQHNEYFSTGLTYTKDIQDLHFTIGLNYDFQQINSRGLSTWTGDFLTDFFLFNNLAAGGFNEQGRASFDSEQSLLEYSRYVGNFGIEKAGQFFLQGSISREGASNLGKNNKWGLFYGLHAGMRLNERFNLRASFSQTGNSITGSAISQERYGPATTIFTNGSYETGYAKIQEANPDLKWEETREFSVGIDFRQMLNNRLSGSLEYYRSKSSDLIQLIPILAPTGNFTTPQYFNGGGLSSSGLEFSFQYVLKESDRMRWDISLIGAQYFNTILDQYEFGLGATEGFTGWIGGRCNFPVLRLEEGQALGEIWGHQLIEENPIVNGGLNWEDTNGNGRPDPMEDFTPIGNAFAKTYLGISNRISWKNFRIDALLRGVLGHDLINHNHSFYSFPRTIGQYNVLEEGFEEFQGLEWTFPEFTNRDVENASFLRLAFLTVAYELSLPEGSGIKNLELSFSAQNLFTLSTYSGMNPEYRIEDRQDRDRALPFLGLGNGQGNPMVPGMDRRNSYPVSRSFILGLKMDL